MIFLGLLFAIDDFARPYMSVRSLGMGGALTTTGLHEENFYGNPARLVFNDDFRFQIIDAALEVNSSIFQASSHMQTFQSGDVPKLISEVSGKHFHIASQSHFPAAFWRAGDFRFALGLLNRQQIDATVRQSYCAGLRLIGDSALAFSLARELFENFSLGTTLRFGYRFSFDKTVEIQSLVAQNLTALMESLNPLKQYGSGAHIELDLGLNYKLPFDLYGFNFYTGASIQNLIGMGYWIKIPATADAPLKQHRNYNFGLSVVSPELWIFNAMRLSLEFQNLGIPSQGSFFKHVHLGYEAILSVLRLRMGLYQGYMSGGLGLQFSFFSFDFATYAEELGLNAGVQEDRRYVVKFSFYI